MARRKTLASLLQDFRSKARLSRNPAHNAQVSDAQIEKLQAIQEWLWEDFAWPHLRVERYQQLQAGSYIISPPEDMSLDRIEKIEVRFNNRWVLLEPGIGAREYALYSTYTDQRAWPVRRFRLHEDEQIELWPIPVMSYDATTKEGMLKFTGIRNLKPLVAMDDRCDLDDRLIVGYAAADELAGTGAKDAKLKLDQVNRLYARLKSDLTPRQRFSMYGSARTDKPRILRGPPTVYYRPADGG